MRDERLFVEGSDELRGRSGSRREKDGLREGECEQRLRLQAEGV
jgi:hypothetical protein